MRMDLVRLHVIRLFSTVSGHYPLVLMSVTKQQGKVICEAVVIVIWAMNASVLVTSLLGGMLTLDGSSSIDDMFVVSR